MLATGSKFWLKTETFLNSFNNEVKYAAVNEFLVHLSNVKLLIGREIMILKQFAVLCIYFFFGALFREFLSALDFLSRSDALLSP